MTCHFGYQTHNVYIYVSECRYIYINFVELEYVYSLVELVGSMLEQRINANSDHFHVGPTLVQRVYPNDG